MNKLIFLKVKIKSLAEEARIIRKEERKANHQREFELQQELRLHRAGIVRHEAFHSLVAYQYLRGKQFELSFPKCDTESIDWDKVKHTIKKYGSWSISEKFDPEAWLNPDAEERKAG